MSFLRPERARSSNNGQLEKPGKDGVSIEPPAHGVAPAAWVMPAVQAKGGMRALAPPAIHSVATRGARGAVSPLPFLDRIQSAFGPAYDLRNVQAHEGSVEARGACQELGAEAYAFGSHVVFRGAPDLHTAAHEAAHVVQQQSGMAPSSGVGRKGDAHERQADAIAARVVAGQSATDLMPSSPSSQSTSAAPSVQLTTSIPQGATSKVSRSDFGGSSEFQMIQEEVASQRYSYKAVFSVTLKQGDETDNEIYLGIGDGFGNFTHTKTQSMKEGETREFSTFVFRSMHDQTARERGEVQVPFWLGVGIYVWEEDNGRQAFFDPDDRLGSVFVPLFGTGSNDAVSIRTDVWRVKV